MGPLSKLVWKQRGLSKAPRYQWWGHDLLGLQVTGHLSCEHSPHPMRTIGCRSKTVKGMEGKGRSHPCGTHRAPSASWSSLLSVRSCPSPCAPGACGSSAGGNWCWLSWSGCHCHCRGRRSPPDHSSSALWKRAHCEECGCGQRCCSTFHGEEAGGVMVPPLPWLNPRFSHSGR